MISNLIIMMLKLLSGVVASLFLNQAISQVNIEIGEPVKIKGFIYDILPKQGSEFLTIRTNRLNTYIESYDNLNLKNSTPLPRKDGDNSLSFRGSILLEDKMAVVYSYRAGDENTFVVKSYSDDMTEENEVKIASQPYKKKLLYRSSGSLSYATSENGEFLFTWLRTNKVDATNLKYEYKIFDASLEKVHEGEFEIPFEYKLSTVKNLFVGNDGKMYGVIDELEENDKKGLFKSKYIYKTTHVMRVDQSEVEYFELKLAENSISEYNTKIDDNGTLYITGLYAYTDKPGVKGLFYAEADFEKEKLSKETYYKFKEDFITQAWSDRQKKKAAKRKKKGKGTPTLYNYYLRDLKRDKNTGDIIGVAEQYYVVVHTYTDSKGNTRTTYTYYYNDLITFKIDKEGEFIWVNKIKKTQVSSNDGGYLSSYADFQTRDKLYLFYNDNEKNYNLATGEYIDQENPKYSGPGRKKNVVTLVEIDLETGEYNRELMLDKVELTSYLVPKKCVLDEEDEEMILFFKKGKKKTTFGRLSY